MRDSIRRDKMMTRRLKRKVGFKTTLTLRKVAPVTRDG